MTTDTPETDTSQFGLRGLVGCVRSLGFRLGWKYWRWQNRARANPSLVLEWADNCDREANRLDSINDRVLADAHRKWAAELRRSTPTTKIQ